MALLLLILLIIIPVLPIVAFLIFIEDYHHPFFIQERIGKNGKKFRIIKFRSMSKNADEKIKAKIKSGQVNALAFKEDSSVHVTKIGRFIRKYSIDELPQLLNIIKGDMAVIGPRPLQVFEVQEFVVDTETDGLMKQRLSVAPGLLCDWQVSKDKDVMSFHERMELDANYASTFSVTRDLGLLAKGIKVVVLSKNQ